jgi:hypothetical protein
VCLRGVGRGCSEPPCTGSESLQCHVELLPWHPTQHNIFDSYAGLTQRVSVAPTHRPNVAVGQLCMAHYHLSCACTVLIGCPAESSRRRAARGGDSPCCSQALPTLRQQACATAKALIDGTGLFRCSHAPGGMDAGNAYWMRSGEDSMQAPRPADTVILTHTHCTHGSPLADHASNPPSTLVISVYPSAASASPAICERLPLLHPCVPPRRW